jgi:hypothetical protein
MEVLKHRMYKDIEVKVVRIEHQKVETINGEAEPLMFKKADRPKDATYEAKNVQVNVGKNGNISFGVTITRSK